MGEKEPAITRRTLYEMVWKEPVEDVAKRFGLSGRGFAKLCERQTIPVPPRGYWQRKAAGRVRVPRPPLIELPEARAERLDQLLKAAVGNSALQQEHKDRQASPFAELYRSQIATSRKIRVPASLTKLHPVVLRWIAAEGRTASALTRTEPLVSRTYRICSALFFASEAAGFKAPPREQTSNKCLITNNGHYVEIALKEQVRQYKRAPTDEERKREPWRSDTLRQIKEPTGGLTVTLSSPSIRWPPREVPSTWSDDEEGKLEDKLPQVLAAAVAMIAFAQDEQRREREQWVEERRQEEAEAERKREYERRKQRKVDLRADAKAWREASDLRAFVEAVQVEAAAGRTPRLHLPVAEWVEWSLAVADEIDPLKRTG